MEKSRAGAFVESQEDWASKTIKASKEVTYCADDDPEA